MLKSIYKPRRESHLKAQKIYKMTSKKNVKKENKKKKDMKV